MSTDNFSAEESLRLIQNMIDKTRVRFSDKSHYFLLWGWGTFLALLGQFVLKSVLEISYHYQVWWITIVCLAITIFWLRQDNQKERTKTYMSESMNYVWTGLGITFFVLTLIFFKLGWQNCYPFFITLYGVGTYVSGRILKFPPFVWGGAASWILAATSVWFNMDAQILFAASAILISYIIPGHLLRMKYHRT